MKTTAYCAAHLPYILAKDPDATLWVDGGSVYIRAEGRAPQLLASAEELKDGSFRRYFMERFNRWQQTK